MTERKDTLIRPELWPGSVSKSVVSPLYTSVVYASDTPDGLDAQYEGETSGYTYAREGHPNATVLAQRIARMEGLSADAPQGLMVGSGMSAVAAPVLGLCSAGDHIVMGDQLYGQSLRLVREHGLRFGMEMSAVDPTDAAAWEAAIQPNTKMFLLEIVSNPTLRVADLAGIAAIAKAQGIMLVIDNTFTTPAAIKPFEHGADVVLHSVTKLMGGHSDVTLGWVAAKDPDLQAKMTQVAVTFGLTPSPFDCWMAERGLLTFDIRFERAQNTAAALADALAEMDGVTRVLYPARPDHPDHNRAAALLGQGDAMQSGNMVTFEVAGGRPAANALATAAQGIAFAPTLGDVGTMLSHPASSSHRAMGAEGREAIGITEGTFRVSVGLEEPGALIAEFKTAVAASQDR